MGSLNQFPLTLHFVKRWARLILLLAFVALAAISVHYGFKKRGQRRREIAYEAALVSLNQVLKPGMSRRQVESYLRMKNKPFQQTCCTTVSAIRSKHSWDDLVRVGQEDAPWFCSQNDVYIAFEFEGFPAVFENSRFRGPDDNDRLQSIALYHRLEGCL